MSQRPIIKKTFQKSEIVVPKNIKQGSEKKEILKTIKNIQIIGNNTEKLIRDNIQLYNSKNEQPYKTVIIQNEYESQNENNQNKAFDKILNPIIPMINNRGNNNCFINVLVQILFHSPEFRRDYLNIDFDKTDLNNPLFQLQILFLKYMEYQTEKKQYNIDIKNFRNKLSKIFNDIEDGIVGDPVEVFNHILNAIHLYKVKHNNLNEFNASKFNCQHSCLSHKFFSIKLIETLICESCKCKNEIPYDENYFLYEIFVFEILEKLHNKTNQLFRNQLFKYSKMINMDIQNLKISECKCKNPKIKRDLIQNEYNNLYLIINLTWDNPIPRMTDICKMYNLIPLVESNSNLFTLSNEEKLKSNYYLYSLVLFYNGHYTCALNTNNKWYFIDDSNYKIFQSYKDLIKDLIKNHYHPIILFYSNNIKYPGVDKNEVFHSEEYNNIYQFCFDFDKRRGENVSNPISRKTSNNTIISKISSNKLNLYIDNNNTINRLSSNSITTTISNGWVCSYCKKKNGFNNEICWCCHRKINPLNIHRESSNNFNLFRDNNINKVGSGLFLNEIEPMNTNKFDNYHNLKEGVEFFFDRRNSSSDILKTRSNQKKSDNDDDDNSYVINSNRNNNPLKLNKVNRSFGKNNHLKNDEFNEYSIFQKSSNKNKKKSIYWICTKCLNKNKDNFCPHCGTKKPQ